jgi:hypothetical protein
MTFLHLECKSTFKKGGAKIVNPLFITCEERWSQNYPIFITCEKKYSKIVSKMN